jgi:hypothetical protein
MSVASDLFEKAMRDAGHIVLGPNQEIIELPDGTVVVVDIIPDKTPTTVTLVMGSPKPENKNGQ